MSTTAASATASTHNAHPRPTGPYGWTWDADANTYLQPPLIGLPFDTMVQNGMGQRHADDGDHSYYHLILVHGLFAAFAFLIFVPAALVCARFMLHGPNPRLAMWGHIGFQTATLICLTVTFVSGYFAVGTENWGRNPHHIIGVVIYGVMLFQAVFGVAVRWRMMRTIKMTVSLPQMMHRWLGRCVFFLGLAQIPLGLYLYGSPLALFILYAVCVFLFLCIWFLCEALRERGWFNHGFDGKEGLEPEMAIVPRTPGPVNGREFQAVPAASPEQTPKRSRFSRFSFRRSQPPVWNDNNDTTSMDTSRAPTASPAVGGLQPMPSRGNIPPVPSLPGGNLMVPGQAPLPGHNEDYSGSESLRSGVIHRDDSDRFFWKGKGIGPPPTRMRDGVLRDSGTLGGPPYSPETQPLQMPEPGQFPRSPTFAGAQPSPTRSGDVGFTPYDPARQPESNVGYVEDPSEPTIISNIPPMIPLPHRPTRSREANVPSASHPAEQIPVSGPPNVAVQVRLNPDGKSVTVRRLNPEEAEAERQNRSRARHERERERERQQQDQQAPQVPAGGVVVQPGGTIMPAEEAERRARALERANKAAAREMEMERARARAHTRQESYDSSGLGGYTSEGGQSSTIAGASGGLLGGRRPLLQSPLVGMTTPATPGGPAGQGSGPGSSVVSAENSELESEILKEQRRNKRRMERMEEGGGGGYGDEHWT